jgi:hypothetical protein
MRRPVADHRLCGRAGAHRPAAIAARCAPRRNGRPGCAPAGRSPAFGPRWRVLNRRRYGAGRGHRPAGRCPRRSAATSAEGWRLHPALLDLATGWAMGLIAGYQPTDLVGAGQLWTAVRVYAPFRPRFVSCTSAMLATNRRRLADSAPFDITLADPQGTSAWTDRGFQHPPPGRRAGPAPAPIPRDRLEFDDAAQTPLSPAEERLRHNLTQGIRPEEGAEAFATARWRWGPAAGHRVVRCPARADRQAGGAGRPPRGQTRRRPD